MTSPQPDLIARLRSDLPDRMVRYAERELVGGSLERSAVAEAARRDAGAVVDALEPRLEPPPPLPVLEDRLAGWMATIPLSALRALGVPDEAASRLLQELTRWILGEARDFRPEEAMAAEGPPSPPPELGAARGGRPSGETAGKVPAVVSAEGPRELRVGREAAVTVRIERREGARPLRHAAEMVMETRGAIAVILTIHGDAVALTDQAMMRQVDPPGPGDAAEVEFGIRGAGQGTARIVVHLQQGSARLAMLEFGVEVTSSGPGREERRRVEAVAEEPDGAADEVLEIIIQETRGDQGVFYTYLVNSRRLDLEWGRFTSPPFQAVAAGGASAPRAFVESIYRRIETEVLESWDDADLLARRLRGIGVTLSDQLFPPELARLLWEGRDRIGMVEVTPFEPWIPWELLRLRKPGTTGSGGVDDRFFAEYRLLRTLSGRSPSRVLGAKKWRYVLGDYPHGLYQPAAGERTFLERTLPGLGVPVDALEPDPGAVLDALEDPDFDAVHFACHGTSDLSDIEASSLVLSDRETADGTVRPVVLTPTDLAGAANLGERRPLVFLNACQSGRHAPVLTDLGGWPKAFLEAGAGAVMATLWSVHENPAVSFAETFYRRLLEGATLADATGDARQEAKAQGDATWLAYTAYGSPSARLVR